MKHPFNRMTEEEKLSAFRTILRSAASAVFLGGAGVDFIFESTSKPRCPKCGGMMRPDVTLYGEFLPKEAHDKARKMISRADLLIIGGTSLQVGSAAGLARQFHGGRMVIINKSKTLMDSEADLVFHDSIGKILTEVDGGKTHESN